MRINWVFADTYVPDPVIDLESVRSIGPTWGSWRTWRSCGTDNVICHDMIKAKELLKRDFHKGCNFYLPKDHFQILDRPMGVTLYHGDFKQEVLGLEDIISINLVADRSDIVLLLGFDLGKWEKTQDRMLNHQMHNRLGLISAAIKSADSVQWVLIDHPKDLDLRFGELTNITRDSMENVLKLLIQ